MAPLKDRSYWNSEIERLVRRNHSVDWHAGVRKGLS
jgi:hypothetical protein